jgi:hypothetical protein
MFSYALVRRSHVLGQVDGDKNGRPKQPASQPLSLETPPHDTRVRSASLAPQLPFLVTSSAIVGRLVGVVSERSALRRHTVSRRPCLFPAHSSPNGRDKVFFTPPRYDLVSTSKRSRAIWTLSELRAAQSCSTQGGRKKPPFTHHVVCK